MNSLNCRPGRDRGKTGAVSSILALWAFAFFTTQIQGAEGAFTVSLDGTAPFSSVQKAIDAAKAGDSIRIGPGTYEGPFTVTKALTLIGADDHATILTAEDKSQGLYDPEVMRAAQEEIRAAKSEKERKAIIDKYRKKYAGTPTLVIKNCKNVSLQHLKLTLRGAHLEGRAGSNAIIDIRESTVSISNCIVSGSPACGITVSDGAHATIETSLVSGVWATGIQVSNSRNAETVCSARITGCDVRNCHHRCITLRAVTDATVVEDCRISGSAWHGIRYDHASPVIRHNLLFENERFGIYASGNTNALVEGNLFYGNSMSGMSCWYNNNDTIKGNTFAANTRSALELLRGCTPTIVKNIFYTHPQSVYREPEKIGTLLPAEIKGNYFWENEYSVATTIKTETDPPGHKKKELAPASDARNKKADPGFAAPEKRDFSLASKSPARSDGAGVAQPVSFRSPWPVQDEEQPVIRDRRGRTEKENRQDRTQNAYQLAKPLIDDIMQIRDAEKRKKAVEKMRSGLTSGDALRTHAALIAFQSTADANYDKAPFREPLLQCIKTMTGAPRVAAFYGLGATGLKPGDTELLLDAASDPSPALRESLSHLLMLYTKGTITGKASDVVRSLLETDDRDTLREVMRGLWGAKVGPKLEARLLEIARTMPRVRHDAIYFALSTLQDKSKAVVEELIECIDKNNRNAGRAMWGLSHGVPEQHQKMVADFMLQVFYARSSSHIRRECLDTIGRYAGPSHAEELKKIAENTLVNDALRKKAAEILERIAKNL